MSSQMLWNSSKIYDLAIRRILVLCLSSPCVHVALPRLCQVDLSFPLKFWCLATLFATLPVSVPVSPRSPYRCSTQRAGRVEALSEFRARELLKQTTAAALIFTLALPKACAHSPQMREKIFFRMTWCSGKFSFKPQ